MFIPACLYIVNPFLRLVDSALVIEAQSLQEDGTRHRRVIGSSRAILSAVAVYFTTILATAPDYCLQLHNSWLPCWVLMTDDVDVFVAALSAVTTGALNLEGPIEYCSRIGIVLESWQPKNWVVNLMARIDVGLSRRCVPAKSALKLVQLLRGHDELALTAGRAKDALLAHAGSILADSPEEFEFEDIATILDDGANLTETTKVLAVAHFLRSSHVTRTERKLLVQKLRLDRIPTVLRSQLLPAIK